MIVAECCSDGEDRAIVVRGAMDEEVQKIVVRRSDMEGDH